jgi:hypothetical protein
VNGLIRTITLLQVVQSARMGTENSTRIALLNQRLVASNERGHPNPKPASLAPDLPESDKGVDKAVLRACRTWR